MWSYPVHRGNFIAKNRLVRSATLLSFASDDGHFNDKVYDTYHDLACGGVGTIIVEASLIANTSYLDKFFRLDLDERIPEYTKLAEVIHEGDCLAIVQINQKDYIRDGKSGSLDVDELSSDDINQIITNHADAALRAKKAGFDGVEIHATHGFLISRFLSPKYNHRSDEYGANRNLILGNIFRAIQDAVGYDFAVWVKVNATDNEDGGVTPDDCVDTCKYLSDLRIGAIEISGNPSSRTGVKAGVNEAYYKSTGLKVLDNVYCPIILVGGIRSIQEVEEDIFDGFEAVSLSRPLICEPDLPNKWLNGSKDPSKCTSCNYCKKERGNGCIQN